MKLSLALAAALLLSACVIVVDREGSASASRLDETRRSSLNEDITLSDDTQTEVLNSINGTLRLKEGVKAGRLNTINGRIEIAANVEVQEINTINGRVEGGTDLRVLGDVKTVNGAVQLAAGTRVDGELLTINGDLQLTHTDIHGRVSTVNGDIDTGTGSRLRGGLTVEEARGKASQTGPTIVIGPESRVDGTIRFEGPGRLFVHQTAVVGEVMGVTAVSYPGERPD